MEGNAAVYQVNPPVDRITGEGRAEFLRTWGPGFDQKRAGLEGGGKGGGGGADGRSICACKLSILQGDKIRHYCGWWDSHPRSQNPWSVHDSIR